MPKLTESTAQTYLDRFAQVAPDATPLWGKMNGAQMLGHVTLVLKYSMGQGQPMPFRGNFMMQYIVGPIMMTGLIKFPKNVPLPRKKGSPPITWPDGDLDSLKAALDEFLTSANNGTMYVMHHPYFGNIGVNGWRKFHAAHFDHHLRQFGA
jgi:hypothetical protein